MQGKKTNHKDGKTTYAITVNTAKRKARIQAAKDKADAAGSAAATGVAGFLNKAADKLDSLASND